jgi:hypothetical protein
MGHLLASHLASVRSRATLGYRYATGPTVDPVASRVRCLVALNAYRRRTALRPEFLAAGPASNCTLLLTGATRARRYQIFVSDLDLEQLATAVPGVTVISVMDIAAFDGQIFAVRG